VDSITRAHPPEIGPLTNDHWIECRRQCRTASRSPVGVSREVPGCGRAAVDLAAGLAVAGVESGGIDSSGVDSGGVDSGGVDSNTDGFFVGQDDWVERQYLADDLDLAADPRVSPMHADSHADLAPAIIGIGHHDPLLDQDLAYAKVLAAAGVPTVLREYPISSTASSAWAASPPAPNEPPASSAGNSELCSPTPLPASAPPVPSDPEGGWVHPLSQRWTQPPTSSTGRPSKDNIPGPSPARTTLTAAIGQFLVDDQCVWLRRADRLGRCS